MSRELQLKMHVSVDGFMGAEDGDLSWVFEHRDAGARDWQLELVGAAGVHLLGAESYVGMSTYWPTSDEPFAQLMNEIPKVVFSRSLTEQALTWGPATLASGDLADEIATLKEQDGGPLFVHGGARFAQAVTQANLVDRYFLIVQPVALGTGLALFGGRVDLRLVDQRTFDSGALGLTYERA
jgi:dihydrofolate reductase